MRGVYSARNIIPLADFRAQAARILQQQSEDHEPVVITRNGRAAGVLVEPQEYERLVSMADFSRAVEAGLYDSAAGRVVSHSDLAAELSARYGQD